MNETQLPDAGILSLLLGLRDQPGWTLYVERLNAAVVDDLNTLRKVPAADLSYLQGEIHGMEVAAGLIDIMIEEIRVAGARQREREQVEAAQEYRERSETPYG